MHNTTSTVEAIARKYQQISPVLTERSRRIWCATEAEEIGRGGISLVQRATGVCRPTIIQGIKDLKEEQPLTYNKIRKAGGGRKKATERDSTLLQDLDELIDPVTRGDPENPLRWSSKSTIKLADELNKKGHKITQPTVHSILKDLDYSMKSNKKTKEGKAEHPDRDAQFHYINEKAKEFQKNNNPVVSVDAKKKENIGLFKNNGKEWSPKGEPIEVNTHDFMDKKLGKAAPYGVYDMGRNEGWVSIGISSDTAEFAVESLRTWWKNMGEDLYKGCTEIMVTCDCGGSNSYKARLWKYELQKFADEIGKSIAICHFPPGTSKWNKIEHRMFSYISQNWRGRPLISLQTIVELIGNTTTKTGLRIQTNIDNKHYEKGRKISDEEFASINITHADFQPLWNYVIHPHTISKL